MVVVGLKVPEEKMAGLEAAKPGGEPEAAAVGGESATGREVEAELEASEARAEAAAEEVVTRGARVAVRMAARVAAAVVTVVARVAAEVAGVAAAVARVARAAPAPEGGSCNRRIPPQIGG